MTRVTTRDFRSRALALLSAMAMLAAVLVSSVVFAAPASAGATNCDSGSGDVCLYKNSSYATGGIKRYSGSEYDYSRYAPNGYKLHFNYCYLNCNLNDSVSSVKNRGNSYNTAHYKNWNYDGYKFRLWRGNNKDLYGHSANNELSSHKWVSW